MPGELGNEETSQQVGHYEPRFEPTSEWMDPTHLEPEETTKQRKRIEKRVRNRFLKGN